MFKRNDKQIQFVPASFKRVSTLSEGLFKLTEIFTQKNASSSGSIQILLGIWGLRVVLLACLR